VRRELIEHFLFPTHRSQALAFGNWLMDYSGSASVVASIRPCAKCMYKLHQSPSAIRAELWGSIEDSMRRQSRVRKVLPVICLLPLI
jgi:hypothetical protein